MLDDKRDRLSFDRFMLVGAGIITPWKVVEGMGDDGLRVANLEDAVGDEHSVEIRQEGCLTPRRRRRTLAGAVAFGYLQARHVEHFEKATASRKQCLCWLVAPWPDF